MVIVVAVASRMAGEKKAANSPPPRLELGAIGIGDTQAGTLAAGQQHVWRMDGLKGQRMAIRLEGDWDSLLRLYMPDNIQILRRNGFSAGNDRAWVAGVTLPQGGAYSIVVSGEKGDAGPYVLAVTPLD